MFIRLVLVPLYVFWCTWATPIGLVSVSKAKDREQLLLSQKLEAFIMEDPVEVTRDPSIEASHECTENWESSSFQCDDGACVSLSSKCDGVDNCADASDESRDYCVGSLPQYLLMGNAICSYSERRSFTLQYLSANSDFDTSMLATQDKEWYIPDGFSVPAIRGVRDVSHCLSICEEYQSCNFFTIGAAMNDSFVCFLHKECGVLEVSTDFLVETYATTSGYYDASHSRQCELYLNDWCATHDKNYRYARYYSSPDNSDNEQWRCFSRGALDSSTFGTIPMPPSSASASCNGKNDDSCWGYNTYAHKLARQLEHCKSNLRRPLADSMLKITPDAEYNGEFAVYQEITSGPGTYVVSAWIYVSGNYDGSRSSTHQVWSKGDDGLSQMRSLDSDTFPIVNDQWVYVVDTYQAEVEPTKYIWMAGSGDTFHHGFVSFTEVSVTGPDGVELHNSASDVDPGAEVVDIICENGIVTLCIDDCMSGQGKCTLDLLIADLDLSDIEDTPTRDFVWNLKYYSRHRKFANPFLEENFRKVLSSPEYLMIEALLYNLTSGGDSSWPVIPPEFDFHDDQIVQYIREKNFNELQSAASDLASSLATPMLILAVQNMLSDWAVMKFLEVTSINFDTLVTAAVTGSFKGTGDIAMSTMIENFHSLSFFTFGASITSAIVSVVYTTVIGLTTDIDKGVATFLGWGNSVVAGSGVMAILSQSATAGLSTGVASIVIWIALHHGAIIYNMYKPDPGYNKAVIQTGTLDFGGAESIPRIYFKSAATWKQGTLSTLFTSEITLYAHQEQGISARQTTEEAFYISVWPYGSPIAIPSNFGHQIFWRIHTNDLVRVSINNRELVLTHLYGEYNPQPGYSARWTFSLSDNLCLDDSHRCLAITINPNFDACTTCCNQHHQHWWGLGMQACGVEPCWDDGTICAAGTSCHACCNSWEFWDSKFLAMCGEEPCWKDGSRCLAGTTCNNNCCSNSYQHWYSVGMTSCGVEPCWDDKTPCAAGTSCDRCCNSWEFWDSKFLAMCGQEPCWADGSRCLAGTTCDNNCCSNSYQHWYSVGMTSCGNEPCLGDATPCLAGTSCNRCCNSWEFWPSKFITTCGQDPCWKDGSRCLAGTTCEHSCCSDNYQHWYSLGTTGCGSEPCWARDSICWAGTSCNRCCHGSSWDWRRWLLTCD